MNRTILIFAAAFIVGAALALGVRTVRHQPYGEPASPSPRPLGPPAAAASAPAAAPVNTLCAICGMDVDPEVATAQYQGKTIGFGCDACPPKFAAAPDRYGPYALKNERAP